MPLVGDIPSGNAKFDGKFGGFRRGSVVLCSGSPDSLAEFFAAGSLFYALSEGEGGAIVLTTQTPSVFRKVAYKRGLFFSKFESQGDFCFVDAYSRMVGKEEAGRVVNGPSDMKGIVASVAEFNAALFKKEKLSFLVIDSLSGLAVHASPKMVAQFIGTLREMVKKTGSVLFLVFVELFDASALFAGIGPLVDVRLDFKREDGSDFVRRDGSEWLELSTGAAVEKGVVA